MSCNDDNDDEDHQGTKENILHEEHNTSPSSSSSSPSPEFSFTVYLWNCSSSSYILLSPNVKTKSIVVDMSPADDIFFQSHLLPRQILSHLPISPRCSAHSRDASTLPKERLNGDKNTQEREKNPSCSDGDNILEKHDGVFARNDGVKAVLKRCTTMVKQTVLFHGRNDMKAKKTRFEREGYLKHIWRRMDLLREVLALDNNFIFALIFVIASPVVLLRLAGDGGIFGDSLSVSLLGE
ncbi:PREDICTED: BRI1 kinase inhibitor 1-like [Tarenaya hassleriana]|uniref:BRI1 kinase inhibitor 1-like n=1 Tax=Tarenaya hassleriana TaxID=28532 RepID=UPI0008FD31CB|nr:PREDICTED: BRI1 kinase inhibitor 1-like [Tarenaya hassleriana]